MHPAHSITAFVLSADFDDAALRRLLHSHHGTRRSFSLDTLLLRHSCRRCSRFHHQYHRQWHTGVSVVCNNLTHFLQLFIAYGLSVYLFYELAPTWANVFGVLTCSTAAIYYYFRWRPQMSLSTSTSTKLYEFRS